MANGYMTSTELLALKPKDLSGYGFIYKITNNINKKIYIGQTTLSINWRFRLHCNLIKANKTMPICHAIQKYGKNKFTVEMLLLCTNKQRLDQFEILLINKYKATVKEFGYNVAPGGQPCITESGRKKISEFHKGKKKSKEHIEKVRQRQLGQKRSKEICLRLKDIATNRSGKSIILFHIPSKVQFIFKSKREASRQLNIVKSGIDRILKRQDYSYKNYKALLLTEYNNIMNKPEFLQVFLTQHKPSRIKEI